MKRILLPILWLVISSSWAQGLLELKLDGTEQGKALNAWLLELESKYPVRFYFMSSWIESINVEENYQGQTLATALNDIFLGSDLNFIYMHDGAIVIVKDPTQAIQRNTLISTAVRERKKIDKLTLGQPGSNPRGQRLILSGIIINEKSKEPMVGATVSVTDLGTGSVTDSDGKFELKLPPGQHIISFTYVNYEEKVIDLEVYTDGELQMALEETPTLLDEVVVSDLANRETTTSAIGQTKISIREIKRAPALLGEVDLIKQIQILPGVTTAGEAASGFNVRGGSVDQNLVLYDGMPVFNSSHVFGFFSAFNAEAIRDVTFYRGGIPAEYGGRISSVLDIRSKEGDYEKWGVSGGIGLISSNLLIDGPLQKDKTSMAISLRSTYSNWLINTIRTDYVDLRNSSVYFYDGAFKLAHKFSDNTKLTVTGYASHDQFRLTGDSTYRWDNLLASARLDHQFSTRLSASVALGTGSYSYELFDKSILNGFNLNYKITYPSAKAEFYYQAGAHKLSFGLNSILYGFDPGTLIPSLDQSSVAEVVIEKQRSIENAVYIGDSFSLGEVFSMDAGVRVSTFAARGPGTVNFYEEDVPREVQTMTDSRTYAKSETIKSYSGIEPRLSLRYSFTPTFSIKGGYNRMFQYLHLVSNTTAITPIDVWQPSNYYFKPQQADQISLGLFKNFKEKTYETFAEVFYKDIKNLLDFKDGAQLILNNHLETDLLQGKGRAYGLETSVTKNSGRLTGSINYTFSRSLRTILGPTEIESVNEGKEYASNFDQPHIVNLVWRFGITRRYYFTGNFTYRTGRPITTPESGFLIDNLTVANFSERNQYRIPDYHRLDVALVIEGSHKRKKIWDGTWSISVYNVYARKNPYSVFFRDRGNGILTPYQLSIIGTALPSISYSFKF